ncbi:hypothetical protein F4801DRAFT_574802 [Xylaria longipes]|nr:hypothetical protein F4801DRAFT_574802 [Xylaria longipes]
MRYIDFYYFCYVLSILAPITGKGLYTIQPTHEYIVAGNGGSDLQVFQMAEDEPTCPKKDGIIQTIRDAVGLIPSGWVPGFAGGVLYGGAVKEATASVSVANI